MTQNVDLFGDPIPENWGRRGRPEHIPTQENRNKVTMLLALGWSNERIARAIGITAPTLRRKYGRELRFRDEQRDRLDANYAMRIWEQVKAGNVGAMRLWAQFLERNDLMVYGQKAKPASADGEKPKEKLGKKEAALLAARTPNSGTPLGELMARRQAQLIQ